MSPAEFTSLSSSSPQNTLMWRGMACLCPQTEQAAVLGRRTPRRQPERLHNLNHTTKGTRGCDTSVNFPV